MKKKILIADDSSFMRMTLKDILEKGGFEIIGEAERGEDAVEKYKKLKPDLVTMDVVMLGEGGIQAVRQILQFDAAASVLMVSAIGYQTQVQESLQAGAKGFVIKPFKPEQVLEEVRRVTHDES